MVNKDNVPGGITDKDIILNSHEDCLKDKRKQAQNFKHIEEEANKMHAQRLLQEVDGMYAW